MFKDAPFICLSGSSAFLICIYFFLLAALAALLRIRGTSKGHSSSAEFCIVRLPPCPFQLTACTWRCYDFVVSGGSGFQQWSGGSSWGWNTFYCLLLLALLSGLVQSDLVHSCPLSALNGYLAAWQLL